MGWGAKYFEAREARQNFLAPHPKLGNRWDTRVSGGALFSLLFINQKDEWCLTSEGGALTIFLAGALG